MPTQPEPVQAEWVPGVSWGSKQAYRVIHQPVSVVSQCSLNAWLSDWLAAISADLQEAVEQRRFATMRYTNQRTLLFYFRMGYETIAIFDQYLDLSPKRYKIWPQLQWSTKWQHNFQRHGSSQCSVSLKFCYVTQDQSVSCIITLLSIERA